LRGTEDTATARLGELFAAQVLRWSQRSLVELCGPAGHFGVDAALRAAWAEEPEAARAWCGAADVTGWARALLRWLQARQQFLIVEEVTVRELVTRALRCAEEAGPADGAELLREQLAALVRGQFSGQVVEVVCSEYSPELQLRVLGLEEVRGPALDVGCGQQRGLVSALRGRGISAEGIDRVHGDDWLRYAYGLDRWGTVVSHHGFSLHFLHHHLRPGTSALSYARVYMDILRSLQVGGVFAYAPGLPFIEAMLPTSNSPHGPSGLNCRVVRVGLPAEVDTPALRALRADTGLAIDHATQVWRRA
jgi:hypothetical protein